MTTTGKNRIMIFGSKASTYVVEFMTAKGEALAISIPRTEAAVIRPGTHAHWGATWAFEPLGPWGPLKTALDCRIGQPFAAWMIHHLRHTCRTLLSKVARDDVAELALGHTLKGVPRTYDHHSYMEEKKAAMKGRKWKIAIRLAVLSSIWLLHVAFLAVFKFSLL
jgi:hypothetical protein